MQHYLQSKRSFLFFFMHLVCDANKGCWDEELVVHSEVFPGGTGVNSLVNPSWTWATVCVYFFSLWHFLMRGWCSAGCQNHTQQKTWTPTKWWRPHVCLSHYLQSHYFINIPKLTSYFSQTAVSHTAFTVKSINAHIFHTYAFSTCLCYLQKNANWNTHCCYVSVCVTWNEMWHTTAKCRCQVLTRQLWASCTQTELEEEIKD